jgi:2-dehydropantoate 2-reductase
MVRECVAVGRAEGAQLGDDVADAVVAAYRAAAPEGVNSMLADRLAGRAMEVDARNGAIVRIGRIHVIQTPSNEMAVVLLLAMTERI